MKPISVFLVDDNVTFLRIAARFLRGHREIAIVGTASSGEEALEQVSDLRPEVILLDLNMPGIGGKEFLRRVKADDDLKAIPVVILTTSDTEEDILGSYKLQAAGYIKKPVSLEAFREVLSKLHEYWFIICKQVPNRTVVTC